MPPEESKKALIVVRTYPTPATKGVEVSCTAAITDKGEWLRIFPVPWRLLDKDQQFRKYQWVDLRLTKASDPRPESYKLRPDGIKLNGEVLHTKNAWEERKKIVFPMRSHCLCCLIAERNSKGFPTLGFFRPKSIARLIITPDDLEWTEAQLNMLRQGNLFVESPKQELEKIPYKFRYEFFCDHDNCPGHKISCTDWEMGQAYRKWKLDYGDRWEEKFRQRYEFEMIHKNDTHFYVGTMHGHPHVWLIVGLFYPPLVTAPPRLFE